MKKLLTLIMVVIFVAGIATSCTEENIQPQVKGNGITEQRGV